MWPFDPVPDSAKAVKRTAEPVPAPLAWLIAALGRSLIVAGLLLLAFAGFQLWGTGIAEARAQEQLAAEFDAALREENRVVPVVLRVDTTPTAETPMAETPTAETPTAETPMAEIPKAEIPEPELRPAPDDGDPVGRIVIPAIDVDKTIVEGTSRDVLRSGPGHYAATPLPGQSGNASIAGHRTTHGAPFFDIDKLVPGDEITVETVDGTFSYLVEGQPGDNGELLGHRIVEPSDVSVIADKGDDRLTLTACHPKYSAEQRIIVTATLITPAEEPVKELPEEPVQERTEESAKEPETTVAVAGPAITGATYDLGAEPNPASLSTLASPSDPLANSHTDSIEESLGWQREYASATFGWAAFTAAIAAAAQLLGRFWRRAPAYAMAVPPFGLALYYCFVNLEHLIPAV